MTRFTRMRHAGARFFRTPKGMLILLLGVLLALAAEGEDRKSTRLNSSH